GYDLPLTARMAASVEIPVIASGGAGTLEHIHAAVTEGKAEAALVASIDDLHALRSLRLVNLAGVISGKALYEGRFGVAEGQAALEARD
ncbi:MAG TPA: HisA/HisF-related TIM barrel protein, partial [Thermoleophilaceae bacterium]|nr:HisA/HisF-related TIM barrel protein [Thermoleophilaceae bacterium]